MKKYTVLGTLGLVIFFALIFVALLFTMPYLLALYAAYASLSPETEQVILIAFYICCFPAAISLSCLFLLLQNIRREQLFIRQNCRFISITAWCCLAVTAVCTAGGFWFVSFFIVALAMVLVFFILRVIHGCFQAATALKEENSLTI